MGKRSDMTRIGRDFYPTPREAVEPLLPYLPAQPWFIEPCAGNGRLIAHLKAHGHRCHYACDIEPRAPGIATADVLFFGNILPCTEMIITNPPWKRELLHPMIDIFRRQAITWLLLDADWMHTVQAIQFMEYCDRVVSVGRVKWFGNSAQSGKDNAAWYRFQADKCDTIFKTRRSKA